MSLRIKSLLVLILAAGILGCLHFPKVSEEELPKSCGIYGYLDMKGAPADLQWVNIRKVELEKAPLYWPLSVREKHYFMLAGLDPGSYQLYNFGGFSGWKNANYTFQFGGQGGGFRIKKPEAYFLGSWK